LSKEQKDAGEKNQDIRNYNLSAPSALKLGTSDP
jgi:hypothetical protein